MCSSDLNFYGDGMADVGAQVVDLPAVVGLAVARHLRRLKGLDAVGAVAPNHALPIASPSDGSQGVQSLERAVSADEEDVDEVALGLPDAVSAGATLGVVLEVGLDVFAELSDVAIPQVEAQFAIAGRPVCSFPLEGRQRVVPNEEVALLVDSEGEGDEVFVLGFDGAQ